MDLRKRTPIRNEFLERALIINEWLVTHAPRGSDIYGIIERIAERLYEEDPRASDQKNWHNAKQILITAGTKRYDSWLPGSITMDINRFAFERPGRDQFSSLDNWIYGQRCVASNLIEIAHASQ